MRYIECDVCEAKFEAASKMIEVKIPSSFLGDSQARLRLDICSPDCLLRSGQALGATPEEDVSDEPPEADTEITQIGGPKASVQRFVPISHEQSRAITGVRIKGVDVD